MSCIVLGGLCPSSAYTGIYKTVIKHYDLLRKLYKIGFGMLNVYKV